MLSSLLKRFYSIVNNRILFDPEKVELAVSKQKEYLVAFPEPKDGTERSFYKYKCLLFHSYSKMQFFFLNILSLFALMFFIPVLRLKGLKYDELLLHFQSNNLLLRKNYSAIPITDIFPTVLTQYYTYTVDYHEISYSDIFITQDAFNVFKNAFKVYPCYFHYQLVLLMRLAQACFLLSTYKPRCVTTYVCEREFADPILTEYYESHKVQYHGFMHGDRLYRISEAFMMYSTYWVWDAHYKNQFTSLRCSSLIKIYTPKKNSGIVKARSKIEDYDYFATYYFGMQTKESIELVKKAFVILKHSGYKCKVRPHPRFSNIKLIKKLFSEEFVVEDTSKVTIEESLECTYLTIAIKSTVLSQAYYSGKKIVLDNMSNPKVFEELREKGYLFIDKRDFLFSEVLESVNKE